MKPRNAPFAHVRVSLRVGGISECVFQRDKLVATALENGRNVAESNAI